MLRNWTYQDYDSIAKQSDTSTGSVDTQLVVLTGQCARFSLAAKQNCITANQIFFLHILNHVIPMYNTDHQLEPPLFQIYSTHTPSRANAME